MPDRVLTLAPACLVLKRVASELASAANDIAAVEARVAALIGHGCTEAGEVEQFQALDRVGQQLRALEAFLLAAAPLAEDCIDLTDALRCVRLEGVRDRLAGKPQSAAPTPAPEFW